jgi:hypothetical protein
MKSLDIHRISAVAVVNVLLATNAPADPPIVFGEIHTGHNSLYNTLQSDGPKHDLSGAATDGQYIIFADDGGNPALANFGFNNSIRVMTGLPDVAGWNLPLSTRHNDLEGATFSRDYFVVTTSLSESDPAANLLTRFRLSNDGTAIVDEESVNLSTALKTALREHFGAEWYNRIDGLDPRLGGLNIEGVSRSHRGRDELIWGLRSPLFGPNFPANINSGAAILAHIDDPFGDASFSFSTVNLQGHGVRSIEWIPALHGYVIIGGPVERGNVYSLWRLRPNGDLQRIELPGFSTLCRPEAALQVTVVGESDYLVVMSEHSGAACVGTPYTIIMAEILAEE